jgi:hypothetical protein
MTTITLEVPDEVSEQLNQHKHQLAELLVRSLRQPPLATEVYRYILDFIANRPTPEQISAFGPTPEMVERRRTLVAKERINEITPAEKMELDEYDRIEHLMVMIKTRNLPFLTGKP